MITGPKLHAVEVEVQRLKDAIKAYRAREHDGCYNTREGGAVRRASLDLSQALVKLRRSE